MAAEFGVVNVIPTDLLSDVLQMKSKLEGNKNDPTRDS